MRNYQTSQRKLAAENGVDWWEVTDENIEDNAYAIIAAKKAAEKINKKFKSDEDRVSWREVLCLPTPDRVSAQVSPTQQQPAEKEAPSDEQ